MAQAQAIPLFTNRTTTGASTSRNAPGPGATYHAVARRTAGSGAVSATIVIEVGNIDDVWETLATIELSGDDVASGAVAMDAEWCNTRARISELGASTRVDVVMGSRD